MKRSLPALLLLSTLAFADAPIALECSGAGGAGNRDLVYMLRLTGLEGNSVVVEDVASKETCSCKFRHGNFFDEDRGPIRIYTVRLKVQSCNASCSRNLKKQLNASIDVSHQLNFGVKRSHATPFVGDEMATCDRFSMDLSAIQRIESDRIDAMDETPEFKRRLKDLKGLNAP